AEYRAREATGTLRLVSTWALVVVFFGIPFTDSGFAGLAAGFGLGMLTILELVLIVRYVQRFPTTERRIASALGMVVGLAVLWGGSNWLVGNLFNRLPDPGDFAAHYWMS